MKRFIFAITLTVLLVSALVAQTSRGIVSGTVSDPNGALVPGAVVKLTNTATSVERSASTNGEGFYRFDAVDLGNYSIRITAPGFSSVIQMRNRFSK